MANIQVKLRRGTEAEHDTTNGGFTGAEGEVTVDTTNDTLRVHDGSTAGGIRLAKLSEVSGGTGTVTSVDSGTGLTGGPITTSGTLSVADNGVTFAKMQDINTAKVIGRTTAGSGDPEEVSILDEDAMTSDSATALATQQSIKAYVDAQVSAGAVSKYSTGWVTTDGTTSVANGATLSFTHNLGSENLIVDVYMATSAAGANSVKVDAQIRLVSTSLEYGAIIQGVTTTGLTVQLAASGWLSWDSNGQFTSDNWGTTYTHIKVVAIG